MRLKRSMCDKIDIHGCLQTEEEEAEVEAAEGMTQLAGSGNAPASSSFGNIADVSPLLALGRSLVQISNQVPQEVGHCCQV